VQLSEELITNRRKKQRNAGQLRSPIVSVADREVVAQASELRVLNRSFHFQTILVSTN
jgi:hypothetical protein